MGSEEFWRREKPLRRQVAKGDGLRTVTMGVERRGRRASTLGGQNPAAGGVQCVGSVREAKGKSQGTSAGSLWS